MHKIYIPQAVLDTLPCPGLPATCQAVLGILPAPAAAPSPLLGCVVNVNLPGCQRPASCGPCDPSGALPEIQGFYLTRQGMHCARLRLVELQDDPEALREEGHPGHMHAGGVTLRAFRSVLAGLNGCGWAVHAPEGGWA